MADKTVNIIVRLKNEIGKGLAGLGAGLKGALGGLASAAGMVALSWAAMGAAMVGSVKKFAESELEALRLARTFEQVGKGAETTLPELKAFATEISKQTTLSIGTAKGLLTLAMNMGIAADDAQQATVSAIGLAAKYKEMGLTAESAMRLIGQAANGNTAMLTRYGIQLDDTLSPQAKFEELLKRGAEGFQHEKDEAGLTIGVMAQLGNAIGSASTEIGKGIVNGTMFGAAILRLKDYILELISSGKLAEWAKNVGESFYILTSVTSDLVKSFLNGIVAAVTLAATFAGSLSGGATAAQAADDAMNAAADSWENAQKKQVKQSEEVKKAVDAVTKAVQNQGTVTTRVNSQITKTQEEASKELKKLRKELETIKEKTNDARSEFRKFAEDVAMKQLQDKIANAKGEIEKLLLLLGINIKGQKGGPEAKAAAKEANKQRARDERDLARAVAKQGKLDKGVSREKLTPREQDLIDAARRKKAGRPELAEGVRTKELEKQIEAAKEVQKRGNKLTEDQNLLLQLDALIRKQREDELSKEGAEYIAEIDANTEAVDKLNKAVDTQTTEQGKLAQQIGTAVGLGIGENLDLSAIDMAALESIMGRVASATEQTNTTLVKNLNME